MLCSYCSPSICSFRTCSSFSRLITIFCSSFGVELRICSFQALYCKTKTKRLKIEKTPNTKITLSHLKRLRLAGLPKLLANLHLLRLQTLRLLLHLQGVLLVQLTELLGNVLILIAQLGVVLLPNLLLTERVNRPLLVVLQLLGDLVVAHQHRVSGLQLALPLVQFLPQQLPLRLVELNQLPAAKLANLRAVVLLVRLLLLAQAGLMRPLELPNPGLVVVGGGALPFEALLDALVLALVQRRRPLQLLLLAGQYLLADLPLLTGVAL